ncbi:hypothetical protein FPSM_01714 [Flavobacterium psychrophilum]|nr:hypothetical protein FPSM_01714 [Flavobacterium psychrophilum]
MVCNVTLDPYGNAQIMKFKNAVYCRIKPNKITILQVKRKTFKNLFFI